ncbi:cytochrome c oxidase assembly protein [Shewanella intestini]|uniref:Cytochrome c oxidase assembly protein CtaG n=1 Tax=Shewanella intestini TaxID=2017544 RepID=A0ABS5I3Y5_9GAMM|nr:MULTISPECIES: cytochrome c oxidase assembly protein [Shewanella]MBR9728080.1 cytochrome c oxidase assembly protein [Shewanella intestini]MRG36552.1 cytochrome c oxidase assembly protein [Shewanella sp. XMDDZSB0408]
MTQTTKSNRKLLTMLILGSVGMFGFGFALVPLYDVLCDALGINGKPQGTASTYEAVVVDKNRTVTIEFIAHVQSGMAWTFTPQVNRIEVHPGQLTHAKFLAHNLSTKDTVGQAIPSVSPGQGAAYFNKTECFCFNQQPLAASATAELPLIFYVDPDLPASINTLTLSYTLYDITGKAVNAIEQGAAK